MQKNLALIAKYFKNIYKPTNNNLRTSSNSRNKNVDTSPRYNNDNQTGRFGNQRIVTIAGARETVGSQVLQQIRIQCFNYKKFGHFAKECRKPKRVKDYSYHKEKMLLCKQAEKGVPLQAEQADWLEDTDEEIDEQELEAQYRYMAKIQEVPTTDSGTDTEPLEHVDSNVIPDSSDMCDNDIQTDQNAEDEHAALANLIENLKLDTQLETYKTLNDRTVDYDKLERKLNETLGLLAQKEIDIKEGLKLKAYEIFVVKEKHDELVKQRFLTKSHYEGLVKEKTTIPYDTSDPANRFIPDREETLTLEKESRSKLNKDLVRPYDYTKQNRVSHRTNVSRPPPRSTLIKEKVMPNNSQVKLKKTEVEDQHRISSISKKTKSVTACNDSLKFRTSNVNVVCDTCGKCVFNSNHDACVSKFLNDVIARTKKPKVVPISTRKPESQANKSDATPPKKTVALESNLEVAFRKSTCFVRLLQGNDLLTGNRGSGLYTISLQETTSSTLIYFMAKASPIQAWLWHRRLSHLNFDHINLLSKKDIVIGLPKLKYVKDQLCSSCEVSKAKRSSFKKKVVPSSKGRLNLLHMDLCGPMRDETPEVLKDFLKMIQRNFQAQVITVRTDRGTKFLNKTLHAYFKEEGIEHQTSTPRTPELNGVVKRRNHTLVEAARTMLLASKLPLFFWAKAIATACYTQNRSITISTHEKISYHIINDKKPSITHLHVFGCTYYLTKDGENLDKMKEKRDPCILVGYSTQSKGYRVVQIVLRFGNDQIAKIIGYGDYQLGNVTISRDLDDVDLLSRSRDINLYTISLDDMLKTSSICLLSKVSKTKSWLWHRRLFHLNFGTLNQLAKDGLAQGIPKLKFKKDHLCSTCTLGKSNKSSHQPKAEDTNQEKLYLLHMDRCGPIRVESVNGKDYILVIVDDYS
ncbi:retrovirus-related pol polyprotein from transposon TNT 1-94 [Tanacetum coccineum]